MKVALYSFPDIFWPGRFGSIEFDCASLATSAAARSAAMTLSSPSGKPPRVWACSAASSSVRNSRVPNFTAR